MLPYSTLLQIDRSSNTVIYQQVANGLVRLIQEGTIKPGSVLPGSREMAAILKLHRKNRGGGV